MHNSTLSGIGRHISLVNIFLRIYIHFILSCSLVVLPALTLSLCLAKSERLTTTIKRILHSIMKIRINFSLWIGTKHCVIHHVQLPLSEHQPKRKHPTETETQQLNGQFQLEWRIGCCCWRWFVWYNSQDDNLLRISFHFTWMNWLFCFHFSSLFNFFFFFR